MAINLAPCLTIFIPFFFLCLLFRHFHCRRYNLRPGPKPWPIIGNLNLIGPIPHHSLHQLSQKYGPIMHLKLGLKHIIVVHPPTSQKPSSKPRATPSHREQKPMPESTQPTITPMCFGPPTAHTGAKPARYTSHNYSLMKAWNLLSISERLHLCFKPKYYKSHGSGEEVCGEGSEWLYQLGRVQGPGGRVFLAQHIWEYWGSDPLAQFLGLAGPCDSCNGYLQCNCRMGNVRVADKSRTLRKAMEGLDRVIGRDRWVEEKDITNLPYIEAITEESMRLRPAAAMLHQTTSAVDSKVLGYDIPGGAQVIFNVWAIGRDAAMWENLNEFNLERFICKDIDVIGQHFMSYYHLELEEGYVLVMLLVLRLFK